MFGKCKVCQEREQRISDLKSEIEYLRRLALPQNNAKIPLIELEANAMLNGTEEQIVIRSPNDENPGEPSQAEIDAEAQRILAGTY